MLHRLIWVYAYGQEPEGVIDHINGVKTDNRLANLRDVPQRVNMQNQTRAHRQSSTGVLGVFPAGRRFISKISVDGLQRELGRFDTTAEAHAAYIAAKRQLHQGNTL